MLGEGEYDSKIVSAGTCPGVFVLAFEFVGFQSSCGGIGFQQLQSLEQVISQIGTATEQTSRIAHEGGGAKKLMSQANISRINSSGVVGLDLP